MAERRFYDIHFHAMNLAHPNILAFINKIKWRLLLLASPLAPVVGTLGIGKDALKSVQNLLTVMENDIGSFFMLVEFYLKQQGLVKNDVITIDGECFDQIVLTPLLMDFGYKNIKSDTFYHIPPQKPMVSQVEDVFRGICDYCNNELAQTGSASGEPTYQIIPRKSKAVFEIYPFLGINTKIYDLPRIEKMLKKYFENYRGCYIDFRNNLGMFTGDINDMRSNLFAGIKLYPPIGFDPWPTADGATGERVKVEFLFQFCCDNQIPITVHCSDGGFKLDKNAQEFTSPERWARILSQQRFETLKLNFAHFGKQSQKKWLFITQHAWRDRILELIKTYPNVYTDFSYIGLDDKHYEMLEKAYRENPKLADRLLFGSDFMINLLSIESYNRYMDVFSGTQSFSAAQKVSFCNINPESFLWRSQEA